MLLCAFALGSQKKFDRALTVARNAQKLCRDNGENELVASVDPVIRRLRVKRRSHKERQGQAQRSSGHLVSADYSRLLTMSFASSKAVGEHIFEGPQAQQVMQLLGITCAEKRQYIYGYIIIVIHDRVELQHLRHPDIQHVQS